jgi:hypothetical protein
VTSRSTSEEPPSKLARAVEGRAPTILSTIVEPQDRAAPAALEAWLEAISVLQRRDLSAPTRMRLRDAQRICGELGRVLAGVEPGEGLASERTLHLALARGRIHAISSMFACAGGTFIELLVTAPWNVLGADDPPDPRTVRGAGTALVTAAVEWSWRRGCGGKVALQAENRRALAFYHRLGFFRMCPEDRPLSLVPRGKDGWSRAIVRVAQGRPGAEEERSPWLLLDPCRAAVPDAMVVRAGSSASNGAAPRLRWMAGARS